MIGVQHTLVQMVDNGLGVMCRKWRRRRDHAARKPMYSPARSGPPMLRWWYAQRLAAFGHSAAGRGFCAPVVLLAHVILVASTSSKKAMFGELYHHPIALAASARKLLSACARYVASLKPPFVPHRYSDRAIDLQPAQLARFNGAQARRRICGASRIGKRRYCSAAAAVLVQRQSVAASQHCRQGAAARLRLRPQACDHSFTQLIHRMLSAVGEAVC